MTMKKLGTLIVAVAVAGIVRAAMVNWGATGIKADPVGTAWTGFTLYLCDAGVYDYSALAADLAAGDFSKLSAEGFVQATAPTVQQGSTEQAKIKKNYSGGSYVAGTSHTFYTLVLNTTGAADTASYFTISQSITQIAPDAGDLQMTFANVTANAQVAWTATPEPTSGMLLLLGFAGIALRRRRG